MSDDLARLVIDLDGLPDRIADMVEPGMEKSALEVKRLMQADLKQSTHFNQIARTVDYEVEQAGDVFTAEVGPNLSLGGSAALQGIAYEGGINGGGGTIPDPEQHAEAEMDTLARYIANEAGQIW